MTDQAEERRAGAGPIVTSRSRIVAYRNCPRLGYLAYDWQATGLERSEGSLPLLNGIMVHGALAELLKGNAPESVISNALAIYHETFKAGIVAEEHVDREWLLAEQSRLLEGLIWAWYLTRLPRLRLLYEFEAIERELTWQIAPLREDGSPPVINQIRCDVLARRRETGGLYYIEWKTTSTANPEWIKGWEHNTQLLSNVLAIEEVLGERCEGVIIEGLLKGRRAVETAISSPMSGRRIQHSPICYGYVHAASGERQTGWTRAKGFQKTPSWRVSSAESWVRDVMTAEEREALFCAVPPIRPIRAQLERWKRQTIGAEREIYAKLQFVAKGGSLDLAFPMNDEHCFRYWGSPCQFEPLCFGEQVEQDPLGSGLYQVRVPHHSALPEELV